jgi:hypothetical protein
MLQLALALALAAEPDPLSKLLAKELEACASDAGKTRRCALVKAFHAGTPANASPPLFTIGTFDEDGVEGLQLLDLSSEGATEGIVKPDDEAERKQFLAIIEQLSRGERKDKLLALVAKDAKSMPHFQMKVAEGSLTFIVPKPLGGHWLRKAPGKILMLSFNGDTHRPALRFSEFPDDRK